MYLNVEISENEYLDKRRKIKAINQFLTLFIKNDTAYISKGIVKLKDGVIIDDSNPYDNDIDNKDSYIGKKT